MKNCFLLFIAAFIVAFCGCQSNNHGHYKDLVVVEHYHYGGSCGSEKYYYTFDKGDGHQVMDSQDS